MAAAETLIVTDSRVHPVKVSKGAPIKWSMVVTGEMTVELSVYFRATGQGSKPVEVPVVNVLHCETASHEWTCPEDGELVFLFDNSFSWFNDKEITLNFSAGGAATAAAAASTSSAAATAPTPVQPAAAPATPPPAAAPAAAATPPATTTTAAAAGATAPAAEAAAATAAEVTDPKARLNLFLDACREVAPKVAEVERLVPEGEGGEKVRSSLAEARRILCEYAAEQEAAAVQAAAAEAGGEGGDGCTIS